MSSVIKEAIMSEMTDLQEKHRALCTELSSVRQRIRLLDRMFKSLDATVQPRMARVRRPHSDSVSQAVRAATHTVTQPFTARTLREHMQQDIKLTEIRSRLYHMSKTHELRVVSYGSGRRLSVYELALPEAAL
jgi:argininosuccinate lyase